MNIHSGKKTEYPWGKISKFLNGFLKWMHKHIDFSRQPNNVATCMQSSNRAVKCDVIRVKNDFQVQVENHFYRNVSDIFLHSRICLP
jgi:hypothetical protein